MPKLALQLIEKEKQERTGKLDLGKCGLRDHWPAALFELTWLEELSLCNRWWDWEKRKWQESPNQGESNYFSSIPIDFKKLSRLKALKIGGDHPSIWSIQNFSGIKHLIQLQSLYLGFSHISNYNFLEKLSNLQYLDLRSNQISDIRFLEKLSSLQSLDLSYNNISGIQFLEKLSSLQSLDLSNNQISDIQFLEKLSSLQSLDLSNNKISDIRFLENLSSLQSLYLRNNKISDIRFLEKLGGLQSLDLSNNQISNIRFLENLSNLQSLYLNSNRISNIRFLENLSSLQSLDLSNNQIPGIHFLEKLSSLQSLYLSNNQISDIRFLEKLSSLQSLDLRNNKITDHSFLEKLSSLQSLDLRNNKITDYSFLKKLSSLQSLYLSNNQITDIQFLEKLSGLQSLDLSYNNISDIRFLEKLSSLQSLDLGNNNISDIRFLEKLSSLQSLYLSNNQISDIRFLEKLSSLQSLYLSNNQISDIRFLEKLSSLQSLYLSNNQISDIRFLEKLSSLQSLDLQYNNISDIQFLEKLSGLQSLDLSSNKISDIRFLEKLSSLQSLDLRDNKISDIRFLEKLSHLQSLYLSYNKITDYSFLEKLNNLQALDLHNNKITDYSFLEKLNSLQSLDLRSNKISNIRFLEKLRNLQSLDLRDNNISDIRFLEKLGSLQSLYLSNNQISDIRFLEKLSSLQSLYLSNNQISDIQFLEKLSSLQSLDLSSNKISDIQFLEKLSSLQSLDLRNNKISDIRFLEKLGSLQSLDLRSNKISDIRFLEKLSSLQSLYLSYNKISDVQFLEKLSDLQSLDLGNNNISDIRFLEKLGSLQSLDLRINKILDIQPLLPLLKKGVPLTLEEYRSGINLYNNPLNSPPPEIVKQGNAAILNFFNQIQTEGEDYLFEAKLLILGESGAGKTSFARKIQDNAALMPEEEDTTRGIEVAQWEFELSKSAVLASNKGDQFSNEIALERALQNGFRANLWDFGGQEIYHSTHRFFLSHRSLYVLLANARMQDTDFNYWMNVAEQLGGESPLLVVINEKQGHRWRIDEPGLKGRFVFFKELLEVNFGNENDTGRLERLRNVVKRYLGELPHIGDVLPRSWAEIRRALEAEKQPFISFERYLDICRAHNMTQLDQVLQLSQYLHDIGVFLHFQKEPVLKNRLFLDANWTTKTVYKLLNDPVVKENKGRFDYQDIQRIWPEAEVQMIHDELLKLLERFNLAYRISQTDQFIAPEHLPEPKPYTQWEHQENLLMLNYEFDSFMPKGIITELIVALHRYIPDQERVWRKGVVLKREEAWAEIIEAYGSDFRIDIKIAGAGKREFLTIICEQFDQILSRFSKLRREKLVPCNCKRCKEINDKSFYKLSELKSRLGSRKAIIDCPKNSFQEVAILPMLEETFDLKETQKFLDVTSAIAEDNLYGAIELVEKRQGKGTLATMQRQLQEAEKAFGEGIIDHESLSQTKNRVAKALIQQEDQHPLSAKEEPATTRKETISDAPIEPQKQSWFEKLPWWGIALGAALITSLYSWWVIKHLQLAVGLGLIAGLIVFSNNPSRRYMKVVWTLVGMFLALNSFTLKLLMRFVLPEQNTDGHFQFEMNEPSDFISLGLFLLIGFLCWLDWQSRRS